MGSAGRRTDSSVSNAETISMSSNFRSVAVSIQRLLVNQRGSGTGTFMEFAYYVMLYRFHRCLQHRHEKRKQREFVCDFEKHRKAERDAIDELHSHHVDPAAASASKPDQIPRRPRSSIGAKKAAAGYSANARPGRSGGQMSFTGGHDAPSFASLSMASVRETTSHVNSLFKNLAMDGVEPVTCIRASEGHIGQIQVQLSANILTRLHNIAAEGIRSDDSFRLQLGYSQLYVKSSASDNKEVQLLRLGDQDPVPAILHASYVAGTLTIYGLELTGAEIMAGTSDKCRTLVTQCQKGAGNLDIHTAFLGTLPSQDLSKMCVCATKKISVNKREVCVNSSVIPIRNEAFNSVSRNIFPITTVLAFATKRSLLFIPPIMQRAKQALTPAWIFVPLLVIVSTHFFPKSAETTVTNSWGKLCRCAYICLSHKFPGLGYSTLQESDSCLSKEDSHIESDIEEEKFDDDGKPEIDDETHPNWQWPIFDTVHDQYAPDSLVRRIIPPSANEKESKPSAAFEVIYYNLKGLPWACQVGVRILSTSLIEVLDELIPEKAEQQVKSRVTLAGTELFFIHRNLKDLVEPLSTDASSSADNRLLHLYHLLRFLKQELHDVEEMYESMKSKRKLSWDMLWAFFPPGETIVYPCSITKVEVCGKVLKTKYRLGQQGPLFIISLSHWDYNCLTWKEYTTKESIEYFEGDLAFENMETRPIHFKGDPEVIKEAFLQQGSLFCKLSMLQQSNFKQYNGLMCQESEKENADGRVMIDLKSFAKMNADYELGSAEPPCEVIRDNLVKPIDISSEPSRMFSPAKVYGFSFHLKKWGCFSICGFTDIQFNDSAFDMLVMDKATKELSECVVRDRFKIQGTDNDLQKSDKFDLIDAKGQGCIFLCYGPPGTGKTLTAESLAEKFHRPLWSLSVSELGTTPASLEFQLMQVMEVTAHWGALLLLDEADVYMERRESSDLDRNAMTGVFLRQLEYYRGVLFLTTNRDFAFDEAFCSRISVFLCYENLTEIQRNEIWKNILDRSGMTNIPSEEDIAKFARYKFNGREIRNVMQTAQTVASSKEEPLDAQHITQALQVLQASIKLRPSSHLKNDST